MTDSLLAPNDGRHARRDRNRTAVVDALLELYGEGELEPGAAMVSLRAGLSPRSLFRYFQDSEDLTRAAIREQLARALPLVPVPARPTDSLEHRVNQLVAARLRLFAAVAPAARVARLRQSRSPALAAQLTETRAFLRRQLTDLFAPELARLGRSVSRPVLAAVDVLCSFESFELLRSDQGLDEAATAEAMVSSLHRLLDAT